MNLLNVLLKTLLGDSSLSALMEKTGLSAAKLKKLIPQALPLLLKYLTGNASTEGGALSLLGALGQHSGTKALHDQIAEADETEGGKILGHIFGKDNDSALKGKVDLSDGLDFSDLVGLLGGGKTSSGGLGGLFGFGKNRKAAKDNALNGNDLLTSLMSFMK